jgi:hypothetical protein
VGIIGARAVAAATLSSFRVGTTLSIKATRAEDEADEKRASDH